MKVGGRRVSYLSVSEFHALDLVCSRIRQAFGSAPYLVGSVLEAPDFRDVDVRLILSDDEYAALSGEQWTLFGLAVSAWLYVATNGLPIDFQVQQQTAANEKHGSGTRNALGVRELSNFKGDGAAAPQPEGAKG